MSDTQQPETAPFEPIVARVVTEEQYLTILSFAGFFRDVFGEANEGRQINVVDIGLHHGLLHVVGEGDEAQLVVEPAAGSVIDYLQAMESVAMAETEVEVMEAVKPEKVPA